jgi:hypothetical protein
MHHYLQLVRRHGAEAYSDEEERQLTELIGSAPGVELLKAIERNARGGYSVTFDRAEGAIEALIVWLESHDWRAVI